MVPRVGPSTSGVLHQRIANKQSLSLLISGDYSDMKITCNDKTWNVHRNIVCAKSDYFKAAIQGKFLVKQTEI